MAIQGHIPERDGVWIGLTIWEYMAKSGKTLEELIDEVYDIVGPFAFERIDLHLRSSLLYICKHFHIAFCLCSHLVYRTLCLLSGLVFLFLHHQINLALIYLSIL